MSRTNRARALGLLGVMALAAPGCSRERSGSPPSSATAVPAEGPSAGEPAAPRPAVTVRSAVTVSAADLPGSAAPPLRVFFGERGAGIAFVADRADSAHVVFNGVPGRGVKGVDQVAISPDGKRIAYAALFEGNWRMLVDEEPGPMSESVGDPVFSPDGRHLAFDAGMEGRRRLVIDGKAGPAKQGFVATPRFSGDSARVAFAEVREEGEAARLVVSDLSFGRERVVASGVTLFQANDAGTRLAAVVKEGEAQRVLLTAFGWEPELTRGEPFESISAIAFDRDGASLAFIGEAEGKRVLVIGRDRRALPYREVSDLAFWGETRFAYCASDGGSWAVVANGRKGPAFDRVVTPRFSPDGRYLVYRARKEGRRFVVLAKGDGTIVRQFPPYEQVFPVIFTPDGKSITYGVKDGNQLAWKVEPLPPGSRQREK